MRRNWKPKNLRELIAKTHHWLYIYIFPPNNFVTCKTHRWQKLYVLIVVSSFSFALFSFLNLIFRKYHNRINYMYRKMLSPAAAKVFALLLLFISSWEICSVKSTVTYDRKGLIFNGQRRILFSGSIHYPRSTPEVFAIIAIVTVPPHSVPLISLFEFGKITARSWVELSRKFFRQSLESAR